MALKCAAQSPRICDDGSIRWYEGDTFSLVFAFTFTDEFDKPIEIQPTDKITVCFRDKLKRIIQEFEVVGTSTIEMKFTKEITDKFKIGKYTYCARFNGSDIRTVMRNNSVVVE